MKYIVNCRYMFVLNIYERKFGTQYDGVETK